MPRDTLFLEFQVLATWPSTFLRDLFASARPSGLPLYPAFKDIRTLLPLKCLPSVSCSPPTAAPLSVHSSGVSLDLGSGRYSPFLPLPTPGGSYPLPHH